LRICVHITYLALLAQVAVIHGTILDIYTKEGRGGVYTADNIGGR
jgi:hypothetical protein